MRIVNVSNFGFTPRKGFVHSTSHKLSNGWIRDGHQVYNFSDRDVARWAGFGHRTLGVGTANSSLLRFVKALQPDLIAFGHADVITPETLARIRNELSDIRIIQWNVDPIFRPHLRGVNDGGAASNCEKILSKAALVDATFVTTAGPDLAYLRTLAGRSFFFPNPVDPSIETSRNFERTDLRTDLIFTLASASSQRHHCGGWRDMTAFVEDLRTRLPDAAISIYGMGRPIVAGPEYQAAISDSRIGLNISRRNDAAFYSSDRLAHFVGNGLVAAMDRQTRYGELFSEDGFIFYSTEEELFARLAEVIGDDSLRQRIARSGYEQYYATCRETQVAAFMLETIFSGRQTSPWGPIGDGEG